MGGINPVPGAIGGNSELDAPGVPSLVGMGFLTKASHNVPKPFSMASMVRFWPDLSSSKTVLSPSFTEVVAPNVFPTIDFREV